MCTVQNDGTIGPDEVQHHQSQLQICLTPAHPEEALLQICNVMRQQNWQACAHAYGGDSIVAKARQLLRLILVCKPHVELLAAQHALVLFVQKGADLLRM